MTDDTNIHAESTKTRQVEDARKVVSAKLRRLMRTEHGVRVAERAAEMAEGMVAQANVMLTAQNWDNIPGMGDTNKAILNTVASANTVLKTAVAALEAATLEQSMAEAAHTEAMDTWKVAARMADGNPVPTT